MNKHHILLSLGIITGLSSTALGGSLSKSFPPQVLEVEMKPELLFSIGSDRLNEDFFGPKYFVVADNGTIYILDSGNSRIQCFSSTGKYLFSFGRYGQGPGELSKDAGTLKILEDGNLYLIDKSLFRITVFSKNGKYIASYKTSYPYDDIALKDSIYYLSNLILREGHKPISFTRDLSRIIESSGNIVEPTPGIIKTVKSSPVPALIENEFTFMKMTSVTANMKAHIIYSQLQPYHFMVYDAKGDFITERHSKVSFDTHFPLSITFKGGAVTKRVTGPVPIIYEPIIVKDDHFYIPIMSPDRSDLFLDLYNASYDLQTRYRIRNIFFDPTKRVGITNIYIDNDHNIYCLVVSREDFPKFFKYRLQIE